MGTADTIMVSNVGSAAISAVSLVDSINILVIQAFSALAAGGTILCSHYKGSHDEKGANQAARQVLLVVTSIAVVLMTVCLALKGPMLRLIFGSVEDSVMQASLTYFLYTSISFPFIALYDAGASIFRAQENTRTPMVISVISNGLNIGGNAVLIWGFGMGVTGAAIATLASRVLCAVVVMTCLRSRKLEISVRNYGKIRPDWPMIKRVLNLGVPSGIENSMFQFGKLAIQSTVSTMGTIAIAAQGHGQHPGECEWSCRCRNWHWPDERGRGVYGSRTERRSCLLYQEVKRLWRNRHCNSCLAVFALTKPITLLGGWKKRAQRCAFRWSLRLPW